MKSTLAASVCRTANRMPLAARARLAFHLRRLGRHPDASNWNDLVTVLLKSPFRIVSIDIFDTVVYRTVVGDQNIERLVCDRVVAAGLWNGTSEELLVGRERAKGEDPYSSSLAWFDALGVSDPVAAADVELGLELELCRPVPGAAWGLAELRLHGKQIVFLSDMHLSAIGLQQILEHAGLFETADEVVSSSDHGRTKGSGELFGTLAAQLDDDYIHAGNSAWVDVAMCEATGRPSVHFTAANPTRFEEVFASAGVLGGMLAGASRRARLETLDPSAGDAPTEKVLVEIGTGVAGLALGAFTLWVRQSCSEAGITKVAYCARDGELPMLMSAALPAELEWADREVYLHGNRRSWLVAGVASLGLSTWLDIGTADENAVLRHGIHTKPLVSSLERLALTPQQIPPGLRIASLDPAQPIPAEEAAAWDELCADERVHDHLRRSSEALLADIRSYLSLLDIKEGKWVLVDVGWRGQLAAMMSATFVEHTGSSPLHLHFGARGAQPITEALLDVDRFAFDGVDRQPPCANIVSAVETITGSGGPRAVGFERGADGSVLPDLSDPLEAIDTPERRLVWEMATRVVALLPTSPSVLPYYEDTESLRDAAGEVFRLYWLEPTDEEAAVLGTFCFELDEAGEVVIPIGAAYQLGALFRDEPIAPRQWRNGSLAITPQPLRGALRIGDRIQRLVHRETRG